METNRIINGDCIEQLKLLPDNSFDAIVTDPPYGLEFMGKEWDKFTGSDTGIMAKPTSTLADKGFDKLPIFRGMDSVQINAFHKFTFEWASECLRVLKPGGHILAFGGSRTYHRLASGIEDAGFEIRDQIMWIYGSGFPKSLNIGKAIDKKSEENKVVMEVKKELGKWLKEKRGEKSQKEISKFFLSKTGRLTGCVANWELGFNLPTWEIWIKLKEILNLDDRFDYLIEGRPNNFIEAEREIIGKGKSGKTAIWQEEGMGDFNITLPSTQQAKEWNGWGTGLKPAHEPIVVARKPLGEKTVALNVLKWGTGGINIDESRIPSGTEHMRGNVGKKITESDWKNNSGLGKEFTATDSPLGRFPANIILECTCEEQVHNSDCPCGIMDSQSGVSNSNGGQSFSKTSEIYGEYSNDRIVEGCGFGDKGGASRYFQNIHTDENCPCKLLDEQAPQTGAFAPVKQDKRDNNVYGDYEYFGDNGKSFRGDFGGASRFFYCAKSSKSERNKGCEMLDEKFMNGLDKMGGEKCGMKTGSGNPRLGVNSNNHPTVKPIKLMEYLVKLITKEDALVLDPFLGSGTTAIACLKLKRRFIGIEKNQEYINIAQARIKPFLVQKTLNVEVGTNE